MPNPLTIKAAVQAVSHTVGAFTNPVVAEVASMVVQNLVEHLMETRRAQKELEKTALANPQFKDVGRSVLNGNLRQSTTLLDSLQGMNRDMEQYPQQTANEQVATVLQGATSLMAANIAEMQRMQEAFAREMQTMQQEHAHDGIPMFKEEPAQHKPMRQESERESADDLLARATKRRDSLECKTPKDMIDRVNRQYGVTYEKELRGSLERLDKFIQEVKDMKLGGFPVKDSVFEDLDTVRNGMAKNLHQIQQRKTEQVLA